MPSTNDPNSGKNVAELLAALRDSVAATQRRLDQELAGFRRSVLAIGVLLCVLLVLGIAFVGLLALSIHQAKPVADAATAAHDQLKVVENRLNLLGPKVDRLGAAVDEKGTQLKSMQEKSNDSVVELKKKLDNLEGELQSVTEGWFKQQREEFNKAAEEVEQKLREAASGTKVNLRGQTVYFKRVEAPPAPTGAEGGAGAPPPAGDGGGRR